MTDSTDSAVEVERHSDVVGPEGEGGVASAKDPLAAELGRRGGLKGGRARADRMTAAERSDAARHAAFSRWERRSVVFEPDDSSSTEISTRSSLRSETGLAMMVDPVRQLRAHEHAAHLYRHADERLAAIVPFLADGLAKGDRCLYSGSQEAIRRVARGLRLAGLDVRDHASQGQLNLVTADGLYVRDGRFDQMGAMDFWNRTLADTIASRATGIRAGADMGWAVEVGLSSDDLLDYESGINGSALLAFNTSTICQFDQRRFGPAAMYAVLRTHAVVFVDDGLYANPFYEPPHIARVAGEDSARIDWMLQRIRDHGQRSALA